MNTQRLVIFSVLAAFASLGPACPSKPVDPGPPEPIDWQLVGPAVEGGAVFSIWGPSDNDIWAVGGEFKRPLVLRYDGSAWSHDEPPANNQLWWVHGAGDTTMVVGNGGAAWAKRNGAWSEVSGGPPGATLYGVWMASATDAWAVGGPFDNAADGVQKVGDVVLRYDGTSFVEQNIPALADRTGQKRLFKVWGTSANDVFIVGTGGLILHYDGSTWTPMESGTTAQLFTITGRGPNDVWAVGGGASGVVLHYDGTAWSEPDKPEFTPQIVQGVWTAPGQPLLISGFYGFTARLYEGVWEEPDAKTPNPIHGIFQDSSGRLWAGGGDIAAAKANYTGVIAVSGGAPVPNVTGSGGPDAGITDTTTDGGPPDATQDTGPVPCDAVATECPAELPHVGGACAGTLSCPFPVEGDVIHTVHTASCGDGQWSISTECDMVVGGGCTVPPLSESCTSPYSGTISGASVEIGPVSNEPFRSFAADEMIELVWGGQGSPMLAYRIQMDGADEVACGNVKTQITIDGTPEVDASQPVVFRCGSTLLIYVIVPASPIDCDNKVFNLGVTVDVEGVGSGTATLQVQGGGHCFG